MPLPLKIATIDNMRKLLIIGFIVGILLIGLIIGLKIRSANNSGHLILKAEPNDSQIIVQGKNKTFKARGVFNQKLSPGFYQVKVEKDGYYPYEFRYQIEKDQIIENDNIYLIKQKLLAENLITAPIINFWPLENYFLYLEETKPLSLKVYNRLTKEKETVFTINPLPHLIIPYWEDLQFLINLDNKTTINNQKFNANTWLIFYLNKNNFGQYTNLTTKFNRLFDQLKNEKKIDKKASREIKWVNWSKQNNHSVYLITTDALYHLDLWENELSLIAQKIKSLPAIEKNSVFFLDENGLLTKYDWLTKKINTLTTQALSSDNKDIFVLTKTQDNVFIYQINGPIFSYHEGALMKLNNNIKGLTVHQSEIFLVFSEDQLIIYPSKKELKANNIKNALFFRDLGHLILNEEDKLSLVDLNTEKLYPLTSGVKQFYYDSGLNYLYFLDSEGLKRLNL